MLCDSNVWLALALFDHTHDDVARRWLKAGLDRRWRQLAARDAASPKRWMDAYLAAFAQAGGYRLVTTDAAFRQFAGLDLVLLGSS
jgi:predicted nucleic acid-binding protein